MIFKSLAECPIGTYGRCFGDLQQLIALPTRQTDTTIKQWQLRLGLSRWPGGWERMGMSCVPLLTWASPLNSHHRAYFDSFLEDEDIHKNNLFKDIPNHINFHLYYFFSLEKTYYWLILQNHTESCQSYCSFWHLKRSKSKIIRCLRKVYNKKDKYVLCPWKTKGN